jgi:hypothetical protein
VPAPLVSPPPPPIIAERRLHQKLNRPLELASRLCSKIHLSVSSLVLPVERPSENRAPLCPAACPVPSDFLVHATKFYALVPGSA